MSTHADWRSAQRAGITKPRADRQGRQAVVDCMKKVREWRDKLPEEDYRRLFKRGMYAVERRRAGESARTVAENAVLGQAARWVRERAPKLPTSIADIEHILEAKGMPSGGPTTIVAEQVASDNAQALLRKAVKERRDESGDKYPPTKLVHLHAAPPLRNRINYSVFDKELMSLTRLGARREDARRWLNEAADTLRQQGEVSSDPDSDDDDMPDMSRRA